MSDKRIVKTTCPRDCYDACGMAVLKDDDEVVKVTGDRDHPVSRGALCGKCALAYNGAWRDPEQRLLYPLRRAGAKGDGRFERLGWDQALSDIAGRLGAVLDDGEPSRIVHAHYTGTCSVLANAFPMRFFNRLGATEAEPDTVCNNAGHVALGYVFGISAKGFDPRTARDTGCLVVWGANPHASAPHAYKHWLKEQPGKLIVVDPVRTPTAELADLHLQPFPGSDAALAFAMLHVMRRDGLLDRDFIAAHSVGFDELEPLIADSAPDWGERMSGVPAARIEAAARLYAAGPSMLWLGQGLQRQPTGGNVFRTVAMLPALTGNVGRPGAGFYYLNGKGPTRGIDMEYVAMPSLSTAPPSKISHMDLAAVLEDPRLSRAFLQWNMNVAASGPQQRRLHAALRRDDLFTVVVDLFQTDSADFADYVLPAASFLEFDDLVASYMHLSVSAQAQAMARWVFRSPSSTRPTGRSSTACSRAPGSASASTR
jgi:anaerobic selenocysteine-containing dehydrogenase